jgi:membrane protease YdiL (CAAX protease family)
VHPRSEVSTMGMLAWNRWPAVARGVLAGAVVASVGLGPWILLTKANARFLQSVPWAILPMSLFLWLFWRYLNGSGWPRETAGARRISLRASALSGDVWGMAIFAGILGFIALFPLLGLMSRLVVMPLESQPIRVPPQMPFATVFLLLVMASVVAGVVEEAAFRGYMQGPIERRHGPIVAILISGALFGLAHFWHHPAGVFAMLPYYVGVAAIYGGLAYATNSILPGLVLHTGGDIFELNRLWMTGQPEWQLTAKAPSLIWETGVDGAFFALVAAFILTSAAAVWAYLSLAALARNERRGMEPTGALRTT